MTDAHPGRLSASIEGPQSIPCGQEMRPRTRLGTIDGSNGSVAAGEGGAWPVRIDSPIRVRDPAVLLRRAGHLRPVVRQMEDPARDLHREPVGGIQAQEPDAPMAAVRDIRPEVDLRKRRNAWQRRDHAGTDPAAERHDAELGRAVERLDLKRLRHQPSHVSSATRQCANSRSCQRMAMIHARIPARARRAAAAGHSRVPSGGRHPRRWNATIASAVVATPSARRAESMRRSAVRRETCSDSAASPKLMPSAILASRCCSSDPSSGRAATPSRPSRRRSSCTRSASAGRIAAG